MVQPVIAQPILRRPEERDTFPNFLAWVLAPEERRVVTDAMTEWQGLAIHPPVALLAQSGELSAPAVLMTDGQMVDLVRVQRALARELDAAAWRGAEVEGVFTDLAALWPWCGVAERSSQ